MRQSNAPEYQIICKFELAVNASMKADEEYFHCIEMEDVANLFLICCSCVSQLNILIINRRKANKRKIEHIETVRI
uniref:Uncharacterized protein n=1 Tax=Heterorhabditis bacteriophora TaxID=37862 RepID=A0A1I7WRF2_HETBA